MGYDVCVYNSYGHRAIFLDLPIVDVLKQKRKIVRRYRTDPVRCPYGVPIRLNTKRKEATR